MITRSVISTCLLPLLGVLGAFLLGTASSVALAAAPFLPPLEACLKRDPAFAISPQEVQNQLNNLKNIVLIDVRRQEDFDRGRIPGSINMPLYTIKSRKIFRNKPLVVINEGINHASLERECERLVTTYGF